MIHKNSPLYFLLALSIAQSAYAVGSDRFYRVLEDSFSSSCSSVVFKSGFSSKGKEKKDSSQAHRTACETNSSGSFSSAIVKETLRAVTFKTAKQFNINDFPNVDFNAQSSKPNNKQNVKKILKACGQKFNNGDIKFENPKAKKLELEHKIQPAIYRDLITSQSKYILSDDETIALTLSSSIVYSVIPSPKSAYPEDNYVKQEINAGFNFAQVKEKAFAAADAKVERRQRLEKMGQSLTQDDIYEAQAITKRRNLLAKFSLKRLTPILNW